MKKAILFIAVAVLAAEGLLAQDTVWMKPAPMNNYFNNNWIDTTGLYRGVQMYFGASRAIARQFVTDDTLQVYGIAAMMVPSHFGYHMTPAQILAEFNIMWPDDPTYNNMEDSLLLFQYNGSGSPELMQQIGDSLPVNYLHTPVSHYIMSNRQPISHWDTLAKPVYERYFSAPQTVHDTFFAGYTTSQWEYDWKDSVYYEKRPPFYCMGFDHAMGAFLWDYEEEVAAFIIREDPTQPYWIFHRHHVNNAYYIFPILTRKPIADTTITDTTIVDTTIVDPVIDTNATDTTIVDTTVVDTGDTVSVRMADYMSRYVSVSPNPAKDAAQVLSSFGISRVELFNAAGARVLDKPASGLKATLDLSHIPAGTYFVRITTPMGTTMKKLTVTR